MKFDKLIGKRVIIFSRKSFRFQGTVKDFDGRFVEIFDELKQKVKMINIDEISEYEVCDD